MAVTLTDNTAKVLAKMREATTTALEEIGKEAVIMTRRKMATGYYRAIYRTGALMRNVQYAVENSGENSVDIGNTEDYATEGVHYAKYVYFGTYKMPARPYLEAVHEGIPEYQKIAARIYKRAFGSK